MGDYALYIYKQLSEKIEELECNNKEIPIYIDYTSGIRDVNDVKKILLDGLEKTT